MKANDITINLATLIELENILGTDAVNQLAAEKEIVVSMRQKGLLLTRIFGYTEAEANELEPDVFEAEISLFFMRWLAKSLAGKLSSHASPPSPTTLKPPSPSSPKRSRAKSSGRRTARSKR